MQIEEVTKLLRARPPGTPMKLSMLCEWMDRLLKVHGQEWVQRNRQLILEEWKFILDFDL